MLLDGATLLGVNLSSDKTNISAMTGDRTAHPILLSLANIRMDVRMKSSSHAFILVALLPCPKFLVKDWPTRGVLESCVIHLCLDIITQPLKLAARAGRMMADPSGFSRFCFTALASYIIDTPEAALIAGVAGKTSHLTMADYRNFGDPTRHEPRTASTTLAQLATLAEDHDPLELSSYIPAAKCHRAIFYTHFLSFLAPFPLHFFCLFYSIRQISIPQHHTHSLSFLLPFLKTYKPTARQ